MPRSPAPPPARRGMGSDAVLEAAAAAADENDASELDRTAAALEKDALAAGLGTPPVA